VKRRQATLRVLISFLAAALGLAALRTPAPAQEPAPLSSGLTPEEEQRLRILSDPEALKKEAARDKLRAPFEIYRSQIPPSDVLPWMKARHWHGLILELRANLDDFAGSLQTVPVAIPGTAYDVALGREARLVKEQRSRLAMPLFLPTVGTVKEVPVELIRDGAIRPDQAYSVALRPLAPHQMLALVLTKEANGAYAAWSRLNATIPASLDREDVQAADSLRYYRLILPLEPDKPLLPTHPLTWTAVSHVFWDGLEPDVLTVPQQEAFLDWLHWGGQLVLMGGAGPKFSVLRESFLEPHLPADPSGEGRALEAEDLEALSASYRPPPGAIARPAAAVTPDGPPPGTFGGFLGGFEAPPRRVAYGRPAPIRPASGRPVQAAGLRPRPGSTVVPIAEGTDTPLAVERRVGRGRITMLAVDPTDPALAAWSGIDTFVRRVVFRRPEESRSALGVASGPAISVLSMQGPDLSWYRIAARDVAGGPPPAAARNPDPRERPPVVPGELASTALQQGGMLDDRLPNLAGVAEWRDDATVPRLCRESLEAASGIKVPGASFVLKVILAYILAVAPLNWAVSRWVFRRKELAWAVAPLIALAFAVGVERAAAYDLGFDSAGDEIDVLELQPGHPRGHLSRFVSIYSTGHARFAARFPDDPTALALPLSAGRSIAGEDRSVATWRAFPSPALEDFTVQPRSLAMLRAEQMFPTSGAVAIEEDGGVRRLRNGLGLELRDAALVEVLPDQEVRETFLGDLAPDAVVDLDGLAPGDAPESARTFDGPDPSDLLEALRRGVEGRPEAVGEVRLVAWTPRPAPGPVFEPALDRHRGATVVLAHLRYGPPPDPGSRTYDLTAAEAP